MNSLNDIDIGVKTDETSGNEVNRRGIRSDVLKIIAMIIMFLDHTGAVIFERIQATFEITTQESYESLLQIHDIYELLRAIGRLAFPIFCYQLAVGYHKTSSKLKYARNLFLFAIISEPIFDIALNKNIFYTKSQSTYFTLLFGFLMIWAVDYFNNYSHAFLIQILCVITACMAAFILKTDYGFAGVVMIGLFALFYGDKTKTCIYVPIGFLIAYFFRVYIKYDFNINTAFKLVKSEVPMIYAFVLIYMDNGVRKFGKTFKWMGYLFYPAHLLLLYVIARFGLNLQ